MTFDIIHHLKELSLRIIEIGLYIQTEVTASQRSQSKITISLDISDPTLTCAAGDCGNMVPSRPVWETGGWETVKRLVNKSSTNFWRILCRGRGVNAMKTLVCTCCSILYTHKACSWCLQNAQSTRLVLLHSLH